MANGQAFLFEVLTFLHKSQNREYIYLDRNIHIKSPKSPFIFPIGEECTRPSDQYFITCINEENESQFKTKLRYPPIDDNEECLPYLDKSVLTVYDMYSKENGYPFHQHK